MKRTSLLVAALLAAGLLGVARSEAWAQGCTVSASGVNFGEYDALAAAPTDGLGQVQVRCPAGQPFSVLLGPGTAAAGRFQQRYLLGAGGAQLAYNLFLDAGRTLVWGDGTGTTQVQAGSGTGLPLVVTVYGRVFPGQEVPPGSYSDTVMVTVLW